MNDIDLVQSYNCNPTSICEDISMAMEQTKSFAIESNLEEKDILFLQLVTEEACYNAYEYCFKNNKNSFSVIWSIDNDSFSLTVLHEGELFEVKAVAEINFGLRGRGLQLILAIMDDVKIHKKGKIVQLEMIKYLNKLN